MEQRLREAVNSFNVDAIYIPRTQSISSGGMAGAGGLLIEEALEPVIITQVVRQPA